MRQIDHTLKKSHKKYCIKQPLNYAYEKQMNLMFCLGPILNISLCKYSKIQISVIQNIMVSNIPCKIHSTCNIINNI